MSPEPDVVAREESSAFLNAWRVLRERWWIVALAAIICFAAALGKALTSTKQYEATSKLLLRKSSLSTAVLGTDVFPTSIDPARDTTTNILLVKSGEVTNAVKRALNLPASASALSDQVTAQSEENADVIDVTARDPSPTMAARIANAFATQYVVFRRNSDRQNILNGEQDLRQRLAGLPSGDPQRSQLQAALEKLTTLEAVQTGNAELVGRAQAPGSPAAPQPKRDGMLGLLLGLALGVAIAFILDYIDRRVKTVEDFEQRYRLRALVAIPQQAFQTASPEMRSPDFEPYRILRGSLTFASVDRRVRVLLVTSAVLGEGKTSVAVNLARAAALSGQRVVLVEADLRRPSFQRHLPVDPEVGGLTTAVVGDHAVDDLIQYGLLGIQNLGVLASGPLPPGSAEIMRSQSMSETLKELSSQHADLVIIDAPPLLPVADAQILLGRPEIDAVLVVARAYYCKREQVRRTRSILDQQRLEPLGLVVTGLRDYHTYEYYGARDALPSARPADSDSGSRVAGRETQG